MRVVKAREFTYPTYAGGIETCLHQLLPSLAELGVEVVLLTCAQRGLPKRERRGRLEVRRIDLLGLIGTLTARLRNRGVLYSIVARMLFMLILPVHLLKAVKELEAEVIHVHCLCALSALPASLVSLLTGRSLVITMHGTFLGYYDKIAKPPLSWMIPAAEKAYLRLGLYDKVLVEDKYTYGTLRNLGIPREKLRILPYPGVDVRRFREAKPISELSGKPIIMHHGRLVQKRGLKSLVEAMPRILKELPKAKLVIAGDGPEKHRLEKLAEDLGVAGHVKFLGFVPHEHIPNLIKSSTVVVIPSLVEGHSASILEAMAAAKPVVATRVGGVVDVVVDGETGILVDPERPGQIADAIIRVLRDEELAKSLAEKAARKAEEYDVKRLAEEELREYVNLMSRKSSRFRDGLRNKWRAKLLIIAIAVLAQVLYLLPVMDELALRVAHIQDELLYGWVTLSACLLWLILKWRSINQALTSREGIVASPIHVMLGLALCASSVAAELMLEAKDFFTAVIPAFMFISGVFAALGSLIPLATSCAYAAGIALPMIIGAFADQQLSEFSANTMTLVLRALGVQASVYGSHIRIPTVDGGSISAYVDHVCAGSTSLSVFTCLFTLITVDLQPKPRWKIPVFLVAGSLGTIGQATLRLIIMGVVGANYGLEAFLTAHKYLGYIIFPLYFIAFTYIYLRYAQESKLQQARNLDAHGSQLTS